MEMNRDQPPVHFQSTHLRPAEKINTPLLLLPRRPPKLRPGTMTSAVKRGSITPSTDYCVADDLYCFPAIGRVALEPLSLFSSFLSFISSNCSGNMEGTSGSFQNTIQGIVSKPNKKNLMAGALKPI